MEARAQIGYKPSHGHYVSQVGDVFYMMFTACKYGGGYYRQGSVFCAANLDRAFQAVSASDNKLVQVLPLKKSLYILTVLRNKKEGTTGRLMRLKIGGLKAISLQGLYGIFLYEDVHYISG